MWIIYSPLVVQTKLATLISSRVVIAGVYTHTHKHLLLSFAWLCFVYCFFSGGVTGFKVSVVFVQAGV